MLALAPARRAKIRASDLDRSTFEDVLAWLLVGRALPDPSSMGRNGCRLKTKVKGVFLVER